MDNSAILNVLQQLRDERKVLDDQAIAVEMAIQALEEVLAMTQTAVGAPPVKTVTGKSSDTLDSRRHVSRGDDGSPPRSRRRTAS